MNFYRSPGITLLSSSNSLPNLTSNKTHPVAIILSSYLNVSNSYLSSFVSFNLLFVMIV